MFDLGCGNGALAGWLSAQGYDVTGVDPAETGIEFANRDFPDLNLHLGSSEDDLAFTYGKFPIVISLEVVEHVYSSRNYARTLFDLVEPGGVAIVSTPYHGYWKNLSLSLLNAWDNHWQPLKDGGHIKFWSKATLSKLLTDAGFSNHRFYSAGRVPLLGKSMICVARLPLRQ